MAANKLKPPKSLKIDFKPSAKQYELWKLLQPDYCPHCGGHIEQVLIGYDINHNPQYKPQCLKCLTFNLPQLILGGGSAGGGKQMSLDSTVCTPFGFRKVKDLKVGNIITSATTGKQQRIIQLHPICECEYFRIHFIDGTFSDCSSDHLWQMHQSRKRTKKKDLEENRLNERVWDAKMMYEWMERKKTGMYKGCNLIVPLCQPVQFTMTNMLGHPKSIPPYILGALLGDGCITDNCISQGRVSFTTMDNEIVDEFIKHGYDMNHWSQKPNNRAKDYAIRDASLIEGLKDIELTGHRSSDKFIPIQYKYSTIEERKELMRGLMDTDGYVDDRGHMSYSTISHQLAEDVAFIVRSLGGIATIKKNPAGYKDGEGRFIQCNDVYDVYIRTKFDPELVHISRKKKRCRYEFNGGNSELGKRITDIESIGKRTGRCITVDEPCGLYVADNFTVTHNSYIGSSWVVSSCLRFENIRAVVARKTLKSLKESTWNTIKMILKDWGLKKDVNYKTNNLEGTLTFWNDSVIIMKEMADIPSDPNFERFGSSEFTIAFADEVSEISEKAIEVLFSRLRWRIHETFKTSRMLMTTNPTMNWVRSRFVQ
ncbi:phage terminase large subunit, partial [Dysgonomonas sp. 520]|uniref:phage terminase large subunit n=1 Tax=Dysgonomonas sp. 520 TaxID=2302931 RepID=UPI0021053EE1